jgi:O-antigen/teichoic acid export membrane protein
MNKKNLLFRGVFFSYAALGTQIFYSFASIPLALSHLSKTEFGMWSLVTTLASFLGMAELGITNAFMRHLFDCKEGGDPKQYGRLFTAAIVSLLGVALFIMICGLGVAFTSASLFNIPSELSGTFVNLIIGQSTLSALNVALAMVGAPLYVHHRQDLSQIAQIGLFVIWYLALHFAFESGWGIYSMLANQAAGFLWMIPYGLFHCSRNGYYPAKGTWALPDRQEWVSVFRYSRDQFIVHVGGLFIMGLPQLLISRILGLESAAAWAVCSRPFGILRQIAIKPFDVALPMLCDQFVKGNMRPLTGRWTDVSQIVLAVSGCSFAVAAANNTQFVELWTGGKISWDATNNWMIALYFYIYGIANVSFGTIGLSKSFGRAKFVPVIQAAVALVLGVPLASYWGMPGLLLGTTLPFVFGMTTFGIQHLGAITGQAIRPLVMEGLVRPTLAIPVAVLAAWACSHLAHLLPGFFGLALSAGTGFLLAALATVFIGVSREVRAEIAGMAMRPLRRLVA